MAIKIKRALVVEDEYLILLLLEKMLKQLGVEVAAKASTLAQALEALDEGASFDVAILDINLKDGPSYPLADRLIRRKTPVLFSTGYGRKGIESRYEKWPVLQKPFSEDELQRALWALQAPI